MISCLVESSRWWQLGWGGMVSQAFVPWTEFTSSLAAVEPSRSSTAAADLRVVCAL